MPIAARVVAVLLTVLTPFTLGGLPACKRSPRPPHDGPVDGAALFARTCSPCHGPEGRGDPRLGAPDLTAPATRGRDDEALRHRIKFGAGRMPPFGGLLDAEEIDALVGQVRAMQR